MKKGLIFLAIFFVFIGLSQDPPPKKKKVKTEEYIPVQKKLQDHSNSMDSLILRKLEIINDSTLLK